MNAETYVVVAGAGHNSRAAPNMTSEKILGELIVAPTERAAAGAWMGQHRMPIPGLYQTGGTTDPGGSVTGGPGRNAAIVMLTDFGSDPEEVMSGAQPAHAGGI